MAGRQDILLGGKAGIELDVLESARQAELGGFIGADAGDFPVAVVDFTVLGLVETADAVDTYPLFT